MDSKGAFHNVVKQEISDLGHAQVLAAAHGGLGTMSVGVNGGLGGVSASGAGGGFVSSTATAGASKYIQNRGSTYL